MDIAYLKQALESYAFGQWTCTGVYDTGHRVFAMLIHPVLGLYIDREIVLDTASYLEQWIVDVTDLLASVEQELALEALIGATV